MSAHIITPKRRIEFTIRAGGRVAKTVVLDADRVIIAKDLDGKTHVELIGDEAAPPELRRMLAPQSAHATH